MRPLLVIRLLLMGLSLLLWGLGGCGVDVLPGYTLTANEAYQIQLSSVPAPAVPGKPLSITVDVMTVDDEAPAPTSVTLVFTDEAGDALGAVLEASGTTWSGPWTFANPGAYDVLIKIDDASGGMSMNIPLTVACPENSAAGESCCDVDDCVAGLFCVVATCQEALGQLGDACLAGADCETDECEDGYCVPEPTCDDGKANGVETDVDCGGDTCASCKETQGCLVPEDCDTKVCESEICGPPVGWPIGKGDGSPGSVTLNPILTSTLSSPTDLAFNPNVENELWIVNPSTDQLTVINNVGQANQQMTYFQDQSRHFLEKVVSLSFSDDGTFGTCGDSRNDYDGFGAPNDFMGPVLWPQDKADFYQYGPDASMVHLDMLHSSPQCMGITAHGNGSKYFVFNGRDGVLDWYDFRQPHSDQKHGGEDHSDGLKRRYSDVNLSRVPGVPSHMHYDPDSHWLYIADTGNSRVVRVNVDTAVQVKKLQSFAGDGVLMEYSGVVQEDFVPASLNILQRPSGIMFHEGLVYVTDSQNGNIHAFDENGSIVRSLDTGLGTGALSGLDVGPDGLIYLTDQKGNRILRIDP